MLRIERKEFFGFNTPVRWNHPKLGEIESQYSIPGVKYDMCYCMKKDDCVIRLHFVQVHGIHWLTHILAFTDGDISLPYKMIPRLPLELER